MAAAPEGAESCAGEVQPAFRHGERGGTDPLGSEEEIPRSLSTNLRVAYFCEELLVFVRHFCGRVWID